MITIVKFHGPTVAPERSPGDRASFTQWLLCDDCEETLRLCIDASRGRFERERVEQAANRLGVFRAHRGEHA